MEPYRRPRLRTDAKCSQSSAVYGNSQAAGGSSAAPQLSLRTQDDLLLSMLTGQQSALTTFNTLYGQLLETTDRQAGSGYDTAASQSTREQPQLIDRSGNDGPQDLEDVESAGMTLLDAADRAVELFRHLRQAFVVR